MAEVLENIANQTQEPDEAMNAYFSKIPNNTFRSVVNNAYNNASPADIQSMANQNAQNEVAQSGTV
jgi:hypothetical protein